MPLAHGTLAQRPTTGMVAGDPYIATDTKQSFIWNGSQWVSTENFTQTEHDALTHSASLLAVVTPLGKYLKDDGTWGTVAGGGDMTKAVYDPAAKNAQLAAVTDLHSNANDHTKNADTDLDATFEASLKNTDNHTSGTTNKVFTATEQTKLAGIATGAQVNNISDVNATDLTDGGTTILHSHAGGSGMNLLKTTADQTINAGAGVFVDITGLTFPVVNGTDYAFHFYITFQSAATTTGWKAGVNCPTGVLDFWAQSDIIANGAAGVATHTERHNTVRDDMTLLTATIAQAVDLAVRIEGRYKCTANGTFAARFANELVSNTRIVVQKGSWGYWF